MGRTSAGYQTAGVEFAQWTRASGRNLVTQLPLLRDLWAVLSCLARFDQFCILRRHSPSEKRRCRSQFDSCLFTPTPVHCHCQFRDLQATQVRLSFEWKRSGDIVTGRPSDQCNCGMVDCAVLPRVLGVPISLQCDHIISLRCSPSHRAVHPESRQREITIGGFWI